MLLDAETLIDKEVVESCQDFLHLGENTIYQTCARVSGLVLFVKEDLQFVDSFAIKRYILHPLGNLPYFAFDDYSPLLELDYFFVEHPTLGFAFLYEVVQSSLGAPTEDLDSSVDGRGNLVYVIRKQTALEIIHGAQNLIVIPHHQHHVFAVDLQLKALSIGYFLCSSTKAAYSELMQLLEPSQFLHESEKSFVEVTLDMPNLFFSHLKDWVVGFGSEGLVPGDVALHQNILVESFDESGV